jgi:hypothetical protein
MYEVLLESLKYYAEHGLGQISTYEASQIVDLLQDQHAEITMLRKMQPVVLTGDSVNSFALATELSETKAKLDKLSKENDALKAYKNYFADCYGQGYEVANYHLNGDLEPLDSFIDGAEAEYNSALSKEENHV